MKYLWSLILLSFLFGCNSSNVPKTEESPTPTFNIEAAEKTFNELKRNVSKAKEAKKLKQKLREDIGLELFKGEGLDISEAELWYEGQNIVKIDSRFYDGHPIGTKHWYFKDGKPVATEIADFIQDEEGALDEKPYQTLFFNSINSKWYSPGKNEASELSDEQNKEWEKLQKLAEKYKPKSE